jgi:hypothetical protein
MNTLKKTVVLGSLIAGSAMLSMQLQAATDTAVATATILTPISITKNVDLAFGDVYPDAVATGTVTVDSTGARTAAGGAALGATAGSAAQFTVNGEPNATYVLTLPAAPVTLTSGANTMTVDTFTSDTTSTLDATGAEIVNVGATLNVGAGQAAGTYSGNVDVTATYN